MLAKQNQTGWHFTNRDEWYASQMGGIQKGTMERNPQNDTIILENIINQKGLGTYKQFQIKKKKKKQTSQSLLNSLG